jgi:predicted dehydrogenase
MKLAMIGIRGHYGYVLQALPGLPELDVAAICPGCEDDISSLRDSLNRLGRTPDVIADYREMLDRVRPDFLCVAGPFEQHAAMSLAGLEHDAHVFCEKPIALTLADLATLEAAHAARPHLRLVSMVGLRYLGPFLAAHAAVRAGRIGQVRMIDARKSYKLGSRPEFYKHAATYGGTIPWVGSHAIDWIYHFSGSPFQTVHATQTRTGNAGHGDLEMAAQCQFVMRNGILASCSLDYLRPPAAPTHDDDRLRLAGSTGVLEVSSGRVELINAEGVQQLPLPPDQSIFLDFVRGRPTEGVPALDARATVEVTRACLLARESADSGRSMDCP